MEAVDDDYSDEQELKEEPKLKYSRLTNDLKDILAKDSVSCLAVHPKFICVGTGWGAIYLLDHQGNTVKYEDTLRSGGSVKGHSVAVNHISIDDNGDFVASCSDDGKVYVFGLYTKDYNHDLNVGRLVKSVALDPNYKSNSGKRFVTGDERLVLHENALFSRRAVELCCAEGGVHRIEWKGPFIAWASDIGVRIYDVDNKCSLGLIKWVQNPQALPGRFKCNLAWYGGNLLLIGWVDMVQIYRIRPKTQTELVSNDIQKHVVEQMYKFTTDFYISGIAPLYPEPEEGIVKNMLNILLLGYSKELEQDGKARRPTLQVVQPIANDYIEVARPDELSLRGYSEYQCNDYHLECVSGENRFFIVSPKDIIVASLYDADDRVAWLIKNQRYEAALEAVTKSQKYTALEIGRAYLNHLLEEKKYEEAGQLCANILGKNKHLWEEEIYKFAKIGQLRSISKYLPVADYRLEHQIYEMVLYEYLKMDNPGFLRLIKEWPPTLYKVPAVLNAVMDHAVLTGKDNIILVESLAILYSHNRQFDKALAVYLKLGNKDVFQLIRSHNLNAAVPDLVLDLMKLDSSQAVALFLEKDRISFEVVESKLQDHKEYLFLYLDALDKKNMKGNIARKYHGQLIELYAMFARDKLLPFLRQSDHYPIQAALDICKARLLYPEMVYLLGRMGNTKEALCLMVDKLEDVSQAIEFCKEQDDPELWQDLIEKSLNKPDFITFLLQNIGTAIDPRLLVRKIAPGLAIPGLKGSLAKMMKDYRLQVTVQEGCKNILVSDSFNLHQRWVGTQQRGINVDDSQSCGACNTRVIHRGNTSSSIVVFFCRHVFHEQCLPFVDQCLLCHSQNHK